MTTAQVVETSVTVNSNSPIQDYVHPDDQTQPNFTYFSWAKASSNACNAGYPVPRVLSYSLEENPGDEGDQDVYQAWLVP